MAILNLKEGNVKTEDIISAMRLHQAGRDRLSVEDKVTRTMVPIGCLVKGLEGLNQLMQMDMDSDGYEKYLPREHDQTYHTTETWRAQGLVNPGGIPYPGITGAGQYHNMEMWEAARDRSRIEGRLLQEAQKIIWDNMEKLVDLTPYQPKGSHVCARMAAMQRWYIDAQNLLYSRGERTRARLAELNRILPRSYDELRMQM